jgi:hypothetical protein
LRAIWDWELREKGEMVGCGRNVFVGLDTLWKKKKSDKDRKSSKGSLKSKDKAHPKEPESENSKDKSKKNSK